MNTHDILDQREADHAIRNYTRVPNMLVDGYQDLHPQDKWLFVCLVRLCGKEGTRYLSLRFIAKKTGFSPSVLSDNKKNGKLGMIGRLHNSGLIHAEIKRRLDSDGEEEKQAQYHITITNTWALNYEYYNPGNCSISEQSNNESVLNQNATVLNQNALDEKCSESERNCSKSERECSDSSTIVRLQSNTTDKITEESKITCKSNVESASADIDVTHTPPSPPSKKRGGRKRSEENNTSNETAQPTLIEMPAAPPTMPAKEAPWTAETIVQITEAKIGKRYQEIARRIKGKLCKTQRQRQLEEAEVIISAGFSRDEFERAYDHRNDDWWKRVKGDLTVEHMTANTERKVMRLIEELEKIANQGNRKQNSPTNQGQTVKHGQRPEDYENSEISRNNTNHLRQLLADRRAKREAANTKGA